MIDKETVIDTVLNEESADDLHAASARFLFSAWQSGWEKRTDHDHRAILAALRHSLGRRKRTRG